MLKCRLFLGHQIAGSRLSGNCKLNPSWEETRCKLLLAFPAGQGGPVSAPHIKDLYVTEQGRPWVPTLFTRGRSEFKSHSAKGRRGVFCPLFSESATGQPYMRLDRTVRTGLKGRS